MKVFKVIIALILSCALLFTQGVLTGTVACNHSISQDSITKAIRDTNFTSQLSEEALQMSSQIADKKTQIFLTQALQTDAASEFMGEYAAAAIDSALQGKDAAQFTKQDLLDLANDSLDELSAQTGVPVSESQKQMVTDYVNTNGDALIQEINSAARTASSGPLSDSSDPEPLTLLHTILSLPFQALLAGVCLILGIFLLALFWRSKLGFIWWAIVSFIVGSLYLFMGTSTDLLTNYVEETGDGTAFSLLLTSVFSQGFTFAGICSLALTAVLTALCLISRKLCRHTL